MTMDEDATRFLKNHDDRCHNGGMATESNKRVPLGPTGERVAENIKRLRGSTQYKELSERLSALGRPIPPLGLRRIESGERRVDVDDLFALAVAFGVAPISLLLPQDGSADLASPMTGISRDVGHNVQWLWARGDEPLALPAAGMGESAERARTVFSLRAKPTIDPRVAAVGYFVDSSTDSDAQERAMMEAVVERSKAQGFLDDAQDTYISTVDLPGGNDPERAELRPIEIWRTSKGRYVARMRDFEIEDPEPSFDSEDEVRTAVLEAHAFVTREHSSPQHAQAINGDD